MSRRKKKPAYNPRSGGRKEIYSAVQQVLRCEDKWKEQAVRLGTMIAQEKAAIANLPDGPEKEKKLAAFERLNNASIGWVDHYNNVYAAAVNKADELGQQALAVVNKKDIKWRDLEMELLPLTTDLAALDSDMTTTLLDAARTIMPAVAEYQLATGTEKENAEMAHVLEQMAVEPGVPQPSFEAVEENETREERAGAAFDAAAQ